MGIGKARIANLASRSTGRVEQLQLKLQVGNTLPCTMLSSCADAPLCTCDYSAQGLRLQAVEQGTGGSDNYFAHQLADKDAQNLEPEVRSTCTKYI